MGFTQSSVPLKTIIYDRKLLVYFLAVFEILAGLAAVFGVLSLVSSSF